MITHEKWPRIKEIFQTVQARPAAERADLLDELCGDDQSLREDVEALLIADASNEDDRFLNTPAYQFVAPILVDGVTETPEFSDGQKVGRYTIIHRLGAGGMGEIYLARDERLGRKVALKFIAREFATNPHRVLRFEQEARAVSSLNHPNVCVVHETGVTETGRHFIAMEYIQGSTLRDKLRSGALELREALHIATEVARALGSAHAAGIIHRDIKPENIMLRPDGYVKVLDFGLAKLAERLPHVTHVSPAAVHTEAGMLMGTVKYMSPEQLRQSELDERSDIWSLGIVLYEMLRGTTPFEALTPNDSIALILGPQTPPLTLSNNLPAGLAGIIGKAIEKDRTGRYRNVRQLEADLIAQQRAVERQLKDGVSSALPKPVLPYAPSNTQPTSGSAIFKRLTSQAISTADFLLSGIKQHKKKAAAFSGAFGMLLLLLLIPGAARLVTEWFDKPEQQSFAIKPFTNTNRALLAAISPDGGTVAHVEDVFGKEQVVLAPRDDPGSGEVVIPPENANYLGITFSRDGNYLYVTRKERHGPGILYRLQRSWDTNVRLKEGVDSPITLSPAGDYFAFVRYDQPKSEYAVMVASVDGGNERVLATRKRGATFSTYGLSWSPDGSTIVCPAGRWDNGFHMDLIGLDVTTGEEQKIGNKDWFSVYQVDWENTSSLIICARERDTSRHQLWRITGPAGLPQKITNDLNEYKGVSVAGNFIVSVRTDRSWKIMVATSGAPGTTMPVASGSGLTYGLSWSKNNMIVHSAMADDRLNILRILPLTLNHMQLTTEGDNYNPVLSSDGRFVVFASKRNDGRVNIWRMNAQDGSGLQQLTFTDGNYYPSISPDNQWVAYDNLLDSKASIWKVPLFGGAAVKVADGYRMPVFSPDSSLIAGRYHLTSGSRDVAIFPAAGGEAFQHVPVPVIEWQRVQWLDDRTFSYIDSVNSVSNLWSFDIYTGVSKQLTFFDSDQIVAYAWSPDFKQVACQRVTNTSDVITINSSER